MMMVSKDSEDLRLISHGISFEVFQFLSSSYLNVTDGRTDRRTDNLLWHNRALRTW